MGILTTPDKEKIKRAIPKANNKIIDATVARLYIAYPDKTQWTYTGLMGAIALVDDLVGHTFFLKLVDITGNRGVLWDQELWVDFEYYQDRRFFHTFEIEECFVGLLFEDLNEASHFYKRVTGRSKHGSKHTVNNKNAIALKKTVTKDAPKAGPRGEFVDVVSGQRSRRAKGVIYYDDQPPPEWRSLYAELASAGITEDMIADNREFIKEYIAKQGGPLVGLEPPIPRKLHREETTSSAPPTTSARHKKAPPPPPPPPPASSGVHADSNNSNGHITNTVSSPSYATSQYSTATSEPSESQSPSPDPEETRPSVPQNRFRVPPMSAIPSHKTLPTPPSQAPATPLTPVAGQRPLPELPNTQQTISDQQAFSHKVPPAPPARNNQAPPPPPRATPNVPTPPPRAPLPPPRAGTGPPMPPSRNVSGPPPPPPPRAARGAVPPPPPPRARATPQPVPPQSNNQAPPPQLPTQLSAQNTSQASAAGAAAGAAAPTPPPPPPPPPPQLQPQQSSQPPSNINSAVTAAATPPPPPPPPPAPSSIPNTSAGGPPPPPPPGGVPSLTPDTGAPSLPQPDAGRDALLASIRGSSISGLRKVDKSNLERPSPLLQKENEASAASATSTGGPPSLADALTQALNKRKEKVAGSDDEDEEW